MTGNMRNVIGWRDFQMAEDVHKKMALGWFDVEYEMYGCAYLDEHGKELYRISSRPADIYTFIWQAPRHGIHPSNPTHLLRTYPVPTGMSEMVSSEVKLALGRETRAQYPADFLRLVEKIADEVRDDYAAKYIWDLADEVEGIFEESVVGIVEGIAHYAFSCCRLTRDSYRDLLGWAAGQRAWMDDSSGVDSRFSAPMHGVAYMQDGRVKVIANGRYELVAEKCIGREEQGGLVGPLVTTEVGYDYGYTLADARNDFKERLTKRCDETFMKRIDKMRGPVPSEREAAFRDALNEAEHDFGEGVIPTLKRYGVHWNALPHE